MRRKPKGAPRFLSGWKDIANYLGKGVRTVQRYESQLGLPVRRPSAHVRGSVIATVAEIDAWVEANPLREALPLSRPDAAVQHCTVDVIRNSIAEMHRLRDEMQTLQTEVKTGLNKLQNSLNSLEGDLQEEHRPEAERRDGGSGRLN
jgi:hypothetical protein